MYAICIFAALFSPNGLGIDTGIGFVPPLAEIFENFVTFFAVLSFILSALLSLAVLTLDDFIPNSAKDAIKKHGVESALKEYTSNKWLLWARVPYFALFIAAGWLWVASAGILLFIVYQLFAAAIVKQIKELQD